MTTSTARRVVSYRRVTFTESLPLTMQQLLANAFLTQKQIKDRLQTVDAAAKEFRFISSYAKDGAYLCGRLTTMERGRAQLVIDDDENATTLTLAAMMPPTNQSGTQQQFVPGILYFVLYGNHIAIVQSQALRTSALEEHLAWLLRDKTKALAVNQGFALKDEPQKATKAKIRAAHVKKIHLGRPLFDKAPPATTTGKFGTGLARFKPSKESMQFIRWFIEEDQFEKLGLKNEIFEGNLEVWIEIRYPKYSRSHPDDSVKLLDELGISLRDVEEGHASLELSDGSIVEGKDLKISGHLDVALAGSVPDETALYTQMEGWLKHLIETGTVAPD